MKIVILDGYTENPGDLSWEEFEKLGDLTVYDRTPPDQVAARIGRAEIVITNKTPVSAAVLAACSGIRYIGVLATGYNVVDVAAAGQRGIPVCNIPTYGTMAVAQHTFALLLELCHHAGAHSESVKSGAWSACPDFCYWNYPLTELAGKTMGIIGYGRIGRAVAKIAKAFGMHVLFYNEPALPDEGQSDLHTLLAKADVLSLHCPLLKTTEGIINKNTIAQMKPGVLLLNTSRGPLIVEEDLARALYAGKVGGAAVDVVSTEPIGKENPLLGAKNCMITPHIAWAPLESRRRLMEIAAANLRGFLNGDRINVVNP